MLRGLTAIAIAWGIAAAPAQAVTVPLAVERGERVQVATSTPAQLAAGNQRLGQLPGSQVQVAEARGGKLQLGQWQAQSLNVRPTGQQGRVWIDGRWYRGNLRLVRRGGSITAINRVGLESYLYSVIAAEMPAVWPMAALKAQAVAARSYVLAHMREGEAPFATNQDFQVYEGLDSEYSSGRRAVRATRGIVLMRGGQIAKTLYAAEQELAENRWGRGMGQKEAKQLAKRGWSWQQVLGEFYPQAKLATLGQP